MASLHTNIASASEATATSSLLVSLASLPADAFETTPATPPPPFPSQTALAATPDTAPQLSPGGPPPPPPSPPAAPSTTPWVLTAADYVNTYKLAQEHSVSACLLLGAESQSLHPEALRTLASAGTTTDLAVAHYHLGPREGLVHSAILYPATRSPFK